MYIVINFAYTKYQYLFFTFLTTIQMTVVKKTAVPGNVEPDL